MTDAFTFVTFVALAVASVVADYDRARVARFLKDPQALRRPPAVRRP